MTLHWLMLVPSEVHMDMALPDCLEIFYSKFVDIEFVKMHEIYHKEVQLSRHLEYKVSFLCDGKVKLSILALGRAKLLLFITWSKSVTGISKCKYYVQHLTFKYPLKAKAITVPAKINELFLIPLVRNPTLTFSQLKLWSLWFICILKFST